MAHPLTMKIPLLEGRREEDEKDWLDSHPGFEFGVYDGKELVSTHPSIPLARRAAKKAIKTGTDIRIRDIHNPDRVYFHEEEDLSESAYPGATREEAGLLDILQQELGVQHVHDAYPLIDFENLKFEIGVAKRLKFPDVTVKVKQGPAFRLSLELAQVLLKGKQSNIRSLKKYVNSRW
jgi:hypothetical protein